MESGPNQKRAVSSAIVHEFWMSVLKKQGRVSCINPRSRAIILATQPYHKHYTWSTVKELAYRRALEVKVLLFPGGAATGSRPSQSEGNHREGAQSL